jgi:hypothetical protein
MVARLALTTALMLVYGLAQAQDHSIGARVGLLGLGVEYGYVVNDRLGVRVGVNGAGISFDREEADIEYAFDLKWESFAVSVDFHPAAGPFRVTGGILGNRNRLDLVSRPTDDVTIGDQTYTPEQVGTLSAAVRFQRTAPFVGVGWDWSRRSRSFGMSFDLGLVRQGTPRTSLTASGEFASDPAFADDLEAERRELQRGLDDFRLLPYAMLGFVFRF